MSVFQQTTNGGAAATTLIGTFARGLWRVDCNYTYVCDGVDFAGTGGRIIMMLPSFSQIIETQLQIGIVTGEFSRIFTIDRDGITLEQRLGTVPLTKTHQFIGNYTISKLL